MGGTEDPEAAVPLLLEAAALDPLCATAQYNLGAAYLMLRKVPEARAAFEASAALAPEAGAWVEVARWHC